MKRAFTMTIALTIPLSFLGCSSVQIRLAGNRTAIHDPIAGLYPAVKRDMKMATHARKGHGIWTGNSSKFCSALYYCDLPLSLVTDTVCLPFDLFREEKDTAQPSPPGDSHPARRGDRTPEE
jgi:uncharacterized protein YceK